MLTTKELDKMGCGYRGAHCPSSRTYFHSGCHIKSPTWVIYDKTTKAITITCSECGKEVAEIKVADNFNGGQYVNT